MRVRRVVVGFSCALLGGVLVGCASSTSSQSSSDSSGSVSDSVSSVSYSLESISGSSSASSREGAYRGDVEDFTGEWLRSGGDAASFYQGVAPIAEDHGITNWQAEEITYEAVGRALRDAGVTDARYESVREALAGNAKAAAWIDAGYGK